MASRKSRYIIKDVDAVREMGVTIFIPAEKSSSKLKDLTVCAYMPSNYTAQIKECHILVGHIIRGSVEKVMFNNIAK